MAGRGKKQLCFPVNKAKSFRSPEFCKQGCCIFLHSTYHLAFNAEFKMFSTVYQLWLTSSGSCIPWKWAREIDHLCWLRRSVDEPFVSIRRRTWLITIPGKERAFVFCVCLVSVDTLTVCRGKVTKNSCQGWFVTQPNSMLLLFTGLSKLLGWGGNQHYHQDAHAKQSRQKYTK